MPQSPFLKSLAGIAAALSLFGCSQHQEAKAPSYPASAQVSNTPRMQLPDFSTLVEREGSAVVNISTVRTVHEKNQDFPDLPEDDPFYDFFRRFAPQHPAPHDYQSRSLGSGFIISQDGYILTNAHVIDDSDEVTVKLTDKRDFKAKVIGSDKRADIALIKINGSDLPTVPIGNPANLKVGEWVLAIGSPFGFDNSVTAGIVSAKGRSLPDENYVPFIQTDVPINPGNSGGPLFNLKGEVVGINSQIYSRTGGYMGLSFAIPIDVAMNIYDELRQHGKVSRGRLGVQIQDLDQELARSFGMKKSEGALVASVEKGSPADRAGLKQGDVILEFAGHPISSSNELPALVGSTKPGTRAKLRIWRNGSETELTVTVGELAPITQTKDDTPQPAVFDRIGLALKDLDPADIADLGISQGVGVDDVKGEAAKAGIEAGDVIIAINHDNVANRRQFEQILAKIGKGQNAALLVRHGDNTSYIPVRIN